MSAQSREHPAELPKEECTPKHLGTLMASTPHASWLWSVPKCSCIHKKSPRTGQLSSAPSCFHPHNSVGNTLPIWQTGKSRHSAINPLLISLSSSLCDVPHLPCAPPQESQQCWLRTEFRLSFKQPQALSFQNTGFGDVPIFNQSQVQRKLACLEVGMC